VTALGRPSLTPDAIRRLTKDGIDRADRRIDEGLTAAMVARRPTFDGVFGPLNDAARIASHTYGQGAFLREVAPDGDVRAAAAEAVDALEQWKAQVPQRDIVVHAVEAVARAVDPAELDADQATLLRCWLSDIRLAGASLRPAERAEVQRLQARLVELQGAFMMNLARVPHVEATPEELAGVPASIVTGLQPGATPGILDVPITDSVGSAILESATDRSFRERVAKASLSKGMPDNRVILEETLAIRRRLAALLGATSWLALRVAGFAAASPESIAAFLDDMQQQLGPLAEVERHRMREALRDEAGSPADLVVEDWDWRHADALQRRAAGVDLDAMRAFLPFEAVFAGLRELSAEVFGVRLIEQTGCTAWHADVRAFDLVDRDTNGLIAHLFVDPFVRPGKQGGAFALPLDFGDPATGQLPTLLLVTNAPAPAHGPSLLGIQETDALFHEYGHILDFALGPGPYVLHRHESWTPMDWIEGPSQFLGRWGLQPRVIARFARHHQTGEPVSPQLVAALESLESLNLATRSLRYLSMGRLDAMLHGAAAIDLDEANRAAMAARGMPFPEGTFFPATFLHLLAGYDGAIYGFLWSQVLRDDLMSRFERDGLLSPQVGAAYRRAVLERPWTQDPLEGLAAFLGRPWNAAAFLARA
jgi:Zn-dependent oligopeptidase